MSNVEFKKWLCRLSLFFLISMSILEWCNAYVMSMIFFSRVDRLLVACRF